MTEINTLKFIPIYSYRAVHFHFIKKVLRKYSIWKLQIETWNQCNSKLWTTCLCVRERLWTSISLLPLTEVRFSKFVVLRLRCWAELSPLHFSYFTAISLKSHPDVVVGSPFCFLCPVPTEHWNVTLSPGKYNKTEKAQCSRFPS